MSKLVNINLIKMEKNKKEKELYEVDKPKLPYISFHGWDKVWDIRRDYAKLFYGSDKSVIDEYNKLKQDNDVLIESYYNKLISYVIDKISKENNISCQGDNLDSLIDILGNTNITINDFLKDDLSNIYHHYYYKHWVWYDFLNLFNKNKLKVLYNLSKK